MANAADDDGSAERIIQIAETRQGSGHWAQPTLLSNTKPCTSRYTDSNIKDIHSVHSMYILPYYHTGGSIPCTYYHKRGVTSIPCTLYILPYRGVSTFCILPYRGSPQCHVHCTYYHIEGPVPCAVHTTIQGVTSIPCAY